MMLMPDWARELTGLEHGNAPARLASERYEQLKADLGHWAAPVLPCEEMARRRAGVADPGAAEAPDRAAAPLSA